MDDNKPPDIPLPTVQIGEKLNDQTVKILHKNQKKNSAQKRLKTDNKGDITEVSEEDSANSGSLGLLRKNKII